MRTFFNYMVGRVDKRFLNLHYLRIGNAKPLLDNLKKVNVDLGLTWSQNEAESLKDFHFPLSYKKLAGSIVNVPIEEDNVAQFRRDFWENFIWKTEDMPIPVAILIPSSSNYGSLTTAECYEALSLIRLTDRPHKIFEHKNEVEIKIMQWLLNLGSIVHRKDTVD